MIGFFHEGQKLSGRSWLLVLLALVIFFIVSMSTAYRSIGVMHENNKSVTNTLEVLALIKELKVELINAESGQRGYLLTSDGQYLKPYHDALGKTDELLASLSAATTELPVQQTRFKNVFSMINKKIDHMQETVSLVHAGERQQAVDRIRSDVGVGLMRELSELIDAMEADELLLLYKHRGESQQDRQFILQSLFATNILGLVLSLVIFLAVYRSSRRVSTLYAQIEQANSRLEDKVEERTFALQQYSDELQRSNRELEEFAFVASHDLQEPLRKIRAFGDRLLKKYSSELGDSGADYIARMHAASERMSHLIDDLLSFSRVTTQQKPFEPVALNSILKSVLDDLEYAIDDTEAVVEVGDLPEIDADKTQISQVFLNLLGNSLKFRRPDVAPIVNVYCEALDAESVPDEDGSEPRDWIRLVVSDNGIGFDTQYNDRVFSLFQRLHGRDQYSGTGIGLALCRKIVERHGGTIVAESEVGVGTQFIITMPTSQYELIAVGEDLS
ncbi:sensor histidine kinase [Gilvimarinus polysaccharolyticus]|uniref:sensor histidine kinase n=1 Tax=Gilvimarinus polysaccharolyticus TaxID=863921 RepID=UPI000673275A|nr:sensor histidine kinase [Gilvimarinus polysaccharolyticus]